nr:hypothetical protein [Plantactinospora sp. BC1]
MAMKVLQAHEAPAHGGCDRYWHRTGVAGAVGWVGEEVEHSAVVPPLIAAFWLPLEEVGGYPGDGGGVAESVAAGLEGGGGDVEDGDVVDVAFQEPVDEVGGAAADVDDRGVGSEARPGQQVQGRRRFPLIPADLI